MSNHRVNPNPERPSVTVKPYSPEQISAYHAELEVLLRRIESAANHYETLEVEALATTGDLKLAYTRATALLHPAFYDLDLPQPEALLTRIDLAYEAVSKAYAVLINFNRRAEYDDTLFRRGAEGIEASPQAGSSPEAGDGSQERRRTERFQLMLPVRVWGHVRDAGKWEEKTHTVDVSVSGALLPLVMPVAPGTILNVSLPLPAKLRGRNVEETNYEVYGIVRRVLPQEDLTSLIGLEFLRDDPPPAYFKEPWATFNSDA